MTGRFPSSLRSDAFSVVPAQAGTHDHGSWIIALGRRLWVPAFAGTTAEARASFDRLLNGPTEGEQTLLDQHRHLAHVVDRAAALLENPRIPLHLLGKFLDLLLIRIGCILHLAQLERFSAHLLGALALAPTFT